MPDPLFKICWAPKVRQDKIWRLYQSDAGGLLDDALLEEVAFALYQRCESILMVTDRRQIPCPNCRYIVVCPEEHWSKVVSIRCPMCRWGATYGQYRDSWRHQDLHGGNAMYAFRAYVDGYPRVTNPRERMVLIDRLINAVHWSIRHHRQHGPAANNVIEGDQLSVMTFLEQLSNGQQGAP